MLHNYQIAIAIGWGIRGIALAVLCFIALLRAQHTRVRILATACTLLAISFFGSLAEFSGNGIAWVRFAETALASVFVMTLFAAIFKLHPAAWISGVVFLFASNVAYALACIVATTSRFQPGAIVIGGALAIGAFATLRFMRSSNWEMQLTLVVLAGFFYTAVILLAIFGPSVLHEWSLFSWTVVWEVAVTLFYVTISFVSWFLYTPAQPESIHTASDIFDFLAYVISTGKWAPPIKPGRD